MLRASPTLIPWVGPDQEEKALDYFETGVVAGRKAAWHGKAIRPEGKEVLTAGEMLRLVPELDSDIDQREVAYRGRDGNWITIGDRVANVREIDDKMIGMVGKDYKVVPPKRIFSFMDELVQAGEASYESAFTMKGGSEVALLMRRPRDILIGGHEEERMHRYLLALNGYDTWGQARALQIFPTDVRAECWNTVQMAVHRMTSSFSIPHTGDMEGKILLARKALDLTFKHDEEFEQIANRLISEPFTKRDMGNLLDKLTVFMPPAKNDTVRKQENRDYARQAIQQYFATSPNLTETPAKGTKWAAYNAIIEWSDWDRPVQNKDGMGRFRRVMLDTAVKDEALALLI